MKEHARLQAWCRKRSWRNRSRYRRMPRVTSGVFVGTSSLDFAPHFFVRFVLDRFRQLGHSVSVITPQTSIPSSLDAGILHVAATRVPGKIVAQLPKDLPILNRKVLDISKRCVSSMLVTFKDMNVGPVIVKTNANYAGLNDFARLSRGHRWVRRVAGFLINAKRPSDAIPYPIYSSIAAVPHRTWADPQLVVERFIPEREGSLYCPSALCGSDRPAPR